MRFTVSLLLILLMVACGRKGDPIAPDDQTKKEEGSIQNPLTRLASGSEREGEAPSGFAGGGGDASPYK